jgi:DNA-binding HxlR family transcriptional regulator
MSRSTSKQSSLPAQHNSVYLRRLLARRRVFEVLDAMTTVHGFNELKRTVAGISSATLCDYLRRLQRAELLQRRVIPSRPPRVEYHLTGQGMQVLTHLRQLPTGSRVAEHSVRISISATRTK